MNLDEIVNTVKTKIHDTSSGAAAAAKTFAALRYKMVWDTQLWRDSLAMTSQAVPAETQVVTLAEPSVDLVVAVAIGDQGITPANFETTFISAREAFNVSGQTVSFVSVSRTNSGLSRLRLLSPPASATTVHVLYKSKIRIIRQGQSVFSTLVDDGDESVIPAADLALTALVEADMLEYKQAYAKAQAKQSEALTLLGVARNSERSQAASRFEISAEGLGEWTRDDWDSAGGI